MAKTNEITEIIDGEPCYKIPLEEFLSQVRRGGALQILDPIEWLTERQRRWYRGVCLKALSDWNGDTPGDWDLRLKAECGGNELLKSQNLCLGEGQYVERLTIVGVGKKNMTAYIENILSKSIEMDWPVEPPDPELRK